MVEKKKITTGTIVRTVVLVLALVNQSLMIAGKEVLPISDEQASEVVTLVITISASLTAWWKNNSFTQAALRADHTMRVEKRGE